MSRVHHVLTERNKFGILSLSLFYLFAIPRIAINIVTRITTLDMWNREFQQE